MNQIIPHAAKIVEITNKLVAKITAIGQFGRCGENLPISDTPAKHITELTLQRDPAREEHSHTLVKLSIAFRLHGRPWTLPSDGLISCISILVFSQQGIYYLLRKWTLFYISVKSFYVWPELTWSILFQFRNEVEKQIDAPKTRIAYMCIRNLFRRTQDMHSQIIMVREFRINLSDSLFAGFLQHFKSHLSCDDQTV